MRAFPPQTTVYPGHMGVTTLGRELETNPFLQMAPRRAVAGWPRRPGATGPAGRPLSEPKIKAPRGTFDVLGEQAAASVTLEERARRMLEGAGYERIETPVFEATELFSRGVGTSTDIVRKEMFTFTDASDRSLTLRPEGTAPVCRAYVEHGMHKRRQPVKLWYLSSFFRHERAQAGRYREFWQVGAEALGSEDPAVDAESIMLLWTLLGEMGVRARLRLGTLGSRESRGAYRELLQAHLRAHEASLSEEVRSRIEQNPLRAFDSDHEGTRGGDARRTAPAGLTWMRRMRSTLRRCADCWTWHRSRMRSTRHWCGASITTRARCSSSPPMRLALRAGSAAGGRYDGLVEQLGRSAHPRHGVGGGCRADPPGGRSPACAGV